ncbi:hypothetical protein L810_1945 [Burkholderia sp. AU4i]|nr:hypothetical protein L810_1945 [Burkholderia sp. AU4i]
MRSWRMPYCARCRVVPPDSPGVDEVECRLRLALKCVSRPSRTRF